MESKKNIILLLIISVLYSCSTVPMNTQTYKLVYAGIFGYEDVDLDSSYIEQLPYSSMKVKIGKGPGGLAILESMNEDKETWVTSDEIFLIIKGGRIIGSYGLVETNLVDYRSKDPNFKVFIDSKQKEFTSYRVLSYDNPEALNVRLKVITTYKGVEQITILNYARELVLIEETIENDYLNWKTTNKFWVDKDSGFVWKSIQTYAPNLPNFKLEVTKRPPL
tara:strand:+ start:404 stop:1066 length:663 start_codon:yes stop_codon:yes gene_type:complete